MLTASEELNVLRVKARALGGGHDVPADKSRSRYRKSLANLAQLALIADAIEVWDNTGDAPHLLYHRSDGRELVAAGEGWSEAKIRGLISPEAAAAG